MKRMLRLPVSFAALFSGERGKRVPYHHMYGKPYCLPQAVVYSQDEWSKLAVAAETMDRIYTKTLRFAQRHLPDPFLTNQLGIHPALIPCARMEAPYHGVSRQDWILYGNEMKIIENNTDTPTGIPETAYLAGSILGEFTRLSNPSVEMDDVIEQAFRRLIHFYQEQGHHGLIAFSCYDWHEEDRHNTLYLMEQVQKNTGAIIFAPIEELEVIPDVGLFYKGEKIAIWYRLYPLEYLVHDTDPDGFATGLAILSLIEQGKLAIINPAQSIISQSKGFLALLWSLYQRSDLFSAEERQAIDTYCLPTYFTDHTFKEQGVSYVAKAFFGREGKGTILIDERGESEEVEWGIEKEEELATRDYYEDQPKIFQKQISMEKVLLHEDSALSEGYLLTGIFVIGGKYGGIMPRIGGRITGNLAYYCPAGVEEERRED